MAAPQLDWAGLFKWSMKHQDGTRPTAAAAMSDADKKWCVCLCEDRGQRKRFSRASSAQHSRGRCRRRDRAAGFGECGKREAVARTHSTLPPGTFQEPPLSL